MTRRTKSFDSYYISYNSEAGVGLIGDLAAMLTGYETGGEETAIMNGDEQLILNGDHFEALCALTSMHECRQYFDAHPESQSDWTVRP